MRRKLLTGLFLIIGILILAYAIHWRLSTIPPGGSISEQIEDTVIFEPKMLYGLNVDSFRTEHLRIKKNQFMAGILNELNVPDSIAFSLIEKLKGIIDLRLIKSNDSYTLFYDLSLTNQLHYLIYEPNNLDYILLDFTYPCSIRKGKKATDTLSLYASGIIQNSLWESLMAQNNNPELAFMLSEVFAWEIDFYRLRRGDCFKILYDQVNIDGEPYKISMINAAWFQHSGEKFYAFNFTKDTVSGFFDEQGNSLRKQLLKTPLKFYRISSRYSKNRFHPVQHRYQAHLGTDYAAPEGTPIRSVGEGIIKEASYSQFNGKYVIVRHNSIYTTQYLHMSRIAAGIKNNVKVQQGQVIGYVGSTGLATGPHVCYRFWLNGKQVDPQKVILPPSTPISTGLLIDFESIRNPLKIKLDSLVILIPYSTTQHKIP